VPAPGPPVRWSRIAALEVLISIGRVAERILDPARTAEILEVVREGSFYGMQTFDQAFLTLVGRGSWTWGTPWRQPRTATTSSLLSSRTACLPDPARVR
jgi:Tfp pilus assembly pilus retraction ATPase PilT